MNKKKALYIAALIGAYCLGNRIGFEKSHEVVTVRYVDPNRNIVPSEEVKKSVVKYIDNLPTKEKIDALDELVENSSNETLTTLTDWALDSMNANSNRYIGNRAYSNYVGKQIKELGDWIKNLL